MKTYNSPVVGKYGKAVVVSSIDPDWTGWAVIGPYSRTAWFSTVEEAEAECERRNSAEIPREASEGAESSGSTKPTDSKATEEGKKE